MELLTPTLIIKIIGGLFATIGVLIGVIWYFLRSEIKEIKDSVKETKNSVSELKTSFSKVPIDFMSKIDCERLHNARNNKKD